MLTISIAGLAEFIRGLGAAQSEFEKIIGQAMTDSLDMAGTESQRRTPVDTGYLRSSIGGEGGFSEVRGLVGEVGTNVEYAIYVHEGHGRHFVGERLFMEKGADAGLPYIERRFAEAMAEVARVIVSGAA